jgi:hypothetical protein
MAVASGAEPFASGERRVPAGLEWNKEIVVRSAGFVSCRIASGAPMAVTLMADRSYRALQRGDTQGLLREDLLLTSDHPDGRFDRTFAVAASGSYWFIVENRSRSGQRMTLSCSEVPAAG